MGGCEDSARRYAFGGTDYADGLQACLVSAELLAAQADLVPWVQMPDGTRGVITLGAARDKLSKASPEVRTIYLAVHGYARDAAVWTYKPGTAAVPINGDIGFEPVTIIALTVLGVAAIVAGAWFAEKAYSRNVEVAGHTARAAASAASLADLARTQLATTGTIDPEIVKALGAAGKDEERTPWLTPLAIGGSVVAIGATALALRPRGRR